MFDVGLRFAQPQALQVLSFFQNSNCGTERRYHLLLLVNFAFHAPPSTPVTDTI